MRTTNTSKVGAVLAMLSTVWLLALPARADCMTPEPLLLWSYPADGERDVPTNAQLWFTSSQNAFHPELSGTLNGRALAWPKPAPHGAELIDRVHVDPGPLEANTAYTLVLTYGGLGEKSGTYELRFTTGAGPAPANGAARVLGYATEAPPQSAQEPCVRIVATQGCNDMIQPSPPLMHRLDVEASSAIAWLMRTEHANGSVLWPAVCGMPRLMLYSASADQCFMLQAVTPGGLLAPETRYCLKGGKAPSPNVAIPTTPVVGIKPRKPKPPVAPLIAKAEPPAATPAPNAKSDKGCTVLRVTQRHDRSALPALVVLLTCAACFRPRWQQRPDTLAALCATGADTHVRHDRQDDRGRRQA